MLSDQGIISQVKRLYRKTLLRRLITGLDFTDSVTEALKSIDLLDGMRWIEAAWNEVEPETIEKCFSRCGFPEALDRDVEGIDCAQELNELTTLIEIPLMDDEEADSLDREMQTSEECGDSIDQVMDSIISNLDKDDVVVSDEADQVEVVDDEPLIGYQEAMNCINTLAKYTAQNLSSVDYFNMTQSLKSAVEKQAYEEIQKKKKQTTMVKFFSPQ